MLRVTLSVLSVCALVSAASAAGPFGRIVVGEWRGGAFTDDKTGEFNSCIVSANYKSGITVHVMVNRHMKWILGFSHQEWQLTPGQAFPIALTFDGQSPFHVNGRGLSKILVGVEMPDNSELITQFRKSRVMTAYAQGRLFQFNLDNTATMLPALVNCVGTVNRDGIANAGNFVLPKKPVVAATPKPNIGSSLRPEAPTNVSAEYQIEAIELATNFILKTSMQNARVLSRSDTPVELASFGAAWRSDEATGFVRIVPPSENLKGIDVAAAVVGNDAKDCKAKFLSGRTTELVDSEVVFKGVSSCEDSEGQRTAHYFIVPRKKGGFVMFSVLASQNKLDAAFGAPKEERLSDFRKAAVIVAGK